MESKQTFNCFGINYSFTISINFDNTVYFSNKCITRQEADSSGENKDEDEHDGGVTEIEDGRSETLHLEFGEIEVY